MSKTGKMTTKIDRTVDQTAVTDLLDWMIDGARPIADGRKIIEAMCESLNAAGVPADRFALFIMTIHPTVAGRRMTWSAAEGCQILEADFEVFQTDEYFDNPLPLVAETRKSLRRRLCDPNCPEDYKIVRDLREAGFTDYIALPVIYINGETHTMSWSTRQPGGFSDEHIDLLERIRAPLTRLIESYVLRLNAANIISTYVGRDAGEKVLGGKIRRGDFETFSASILFADLKNYTRLSNEESADKVIDTLNQFYDAFEQPILENKGEILKFMGDGLLAIFPLSEESREAAVESARAASRAVGQARRNLQKDAPEIGFRSALHIGSMNYGNIGASRRLDFTAIGPQVNLTARLLGAASAINVDDVCSDYIGYLLEGHYEPHDEVELKGFDSMQSIYRRCKGAE